MDEKPTKKQISHLSENERKQLFHKFIDAGGKVVDENKRKGLTIDRNKQKELIKQIKLKEQSKDSNLGLQALEDIQAGDYDLLTKKVRFRDRITIYFKGLFNNVITLFGNRLNKKFFDFLKTKVFLNLKNFQAMVDYILSSDESTMSEIKNTLDKRSPYYYALLKKYAGLFNEEEFNSILYFNNKTRFYNVKPKHIEEPLKDIFKHMYVLHGYVYGSLTTLQIALAIIARKRNWSKSIYDRRINQIRYSLNLVFNQLYPKLHTIILIILEKIYLSNLQELSVIWI